MIHAIIKNPFMYCVNFYSRASRREILIDTAKIYCEMMTAENEDESASMSISFDLIIAEREKEI